jgi:hypothetical protein
MHIKDCMTKHVTKLTLDESITKAADIMRD